MLNYNNWNESALNDLELSPTAHTDFPEHQ